MPASHNFTKPAAPPVAPEARLPAVAVISPVVAVTPVAPVTAPEALSEPVVPLSVMVTSVCGVALLSLISNPSPSARLIVGCVASVKASAPAVTLIAFAVPVPLVALTLSPVPAKLPFAIALTVRPVAATFVVASLVASDVIAAPANAAPVGVPP